MKKLMEFEIKDDVYEVYGDYQPDYSTVFEPDVIGSVLMNGDKMQSFGKTWTDVVLDEKDFLGMAIAAYVNEDTNVHFTEVCEEIESFKDNVQTYTHEVNGRKIPNTVVTHMGDALDLVALSETGGYYANGTLSVATRTDGSIATDVEAFVENALEEDYEQGKMIYMSKEVKEYLQELVGEYHQEYVGDRQGEWDMEQVIEGLKDMHIKYDLLQSEPEIGNEGKRAEAIGKAIKWLENPKAMAFVPENDFNAVYDTLKVMKAEVGEKRDKYLKIGYEDAPIIQEDYLPLDYAVNKLAGNYHYYQTEILDLKTSKYPSEPECGVVHFRQGNLSGYELIPMEILEGGYLKDEEAVAKLVQTGEFELPDLYALPHYSDISPALLALYDEVKELNPAEFFCIEQELTDIAKSSKSLKGQSAQDIIAQIEADMLLYPNLRESIEIDPYDTETCCVNFLKEFRTCIADDYDGGRYKKMAPIHGDVPGEKIFGQIEKALDVVAERDTHTIPNGGEVDRTLKEALSDFESLSGQEVLVSLKHEAEVKDVRKGSMVLHGTMKFETQKDRQEAYKWAKKWLNKPAKELVQEIHKMQEKGKSQGR